MVLKGQLVLSTVLTSLAGLILPLGCPPSTQFFPFIFPCPEKSLHWQAETLLSLSSDAEAQCQLALHQCQRCNATPVLSALLYCYFSFETWGSFTHTCHGVRSALCVFYPVWVKMKGTPHMDMLSELPQAAYRSTLTDQKVWMQLVVATS